LALNELSSKKCVWKMLIKLTPDAINESKKEGEVEVEKHRR